MVKLRKKIEIYCIICVTAPLPIYILGPRSSDCEKFYEGIGFDGGELAENITCLGNL